MPGWFCCCKAAGTERINYFMRGIYSNDVLIPSALAADLSGALHDFVRAYMFEAAAAHQVQSSFFPLMPKLHSLHEIGHELLRQSKIAEFCVNPAAHSCSLDEDFIGRCAAVSRTVSPRVIAKRTLERYLAHIQVAWARDFKVAGKGR